MPFTSLEELILSTGYLGLFFIVFAESGLLFGFFFPGDSLLVTAGLLASRGLLDLKLLIILTIIAAITGDSVGYWFGHKTGPKIFRREDSLLFHKKNLIRANQFYQKHGGKTIILARFMPFIRTFAPIVAGVGTMQYTKFLFYNIFGGIFWVLLTTLFGFFLGSVIPDIDRYIFLVITAIILVSVAPSAIHFWREYGPEIMVRLKKR